VSLLAEPPAGTRAAVRRQPDGDDPSIVDMTRRRLRVQAWTRFFLRQVGEAAGDEVLRRRRSRGMADHQDKLRHDLHDDRRAKEAEIARNGGSRRRPSSSTESASRDAPGPDPVPGRSDRGDAHRPARLKPPPRHRLRGPADHRSARHPPAGPPAKAAAARRRPGRSRCRLGSQPAGIVTCTLLAKSSSPRRRPDDPVRRQASNAPRERRHVGCRYAPPSVPDRGIRILQNKVYDNAWNTINSSLLTVFDSLDNNKTTWTTKPLQNTLSVLNIQYFNASTLAKRFANNFLY